MGRPTDWSPLADSDPLPGDPEAITAEGQRLGNMATEMREQISRLHAIANDDTLTGQYADTLRTAATDLAGKMDKTVGRYQQVSGELTSWSPELDQAQAESLQALQRAKAAEAQRVANAAVMGPAAGAHAAPPSPAEIAAEKRREAALDEALHDLKIARQQLDDAVQYAQTQGRRHAERIREAIDDDVADSMWDDAKGVIDRNAGWIKEVTKVLSYVAAALAVVALFIPGLNLLVLGLTLGVLASQYVLAETGNGSWTDVALTGFALATFGLGKVATSGLRGVKAATRSARASTVGQATRNASLGTSAPIRNGVQHIASNRFASAGMRRIAQGSIDDTYRVANEAGERAAYHIRTAPDASWRSTTWSQRLRAGDPYAARDFNEITRLRHGFPNDAAVQTASRNANTWRNINAGSAHTSVGVDTTDKILDDAISVDAYNNTKGHFREAQGSTW